MLSALAPLDRLSTLIKIKQRRFLADGYCGERCCSQRNKTIKNNVMGIARVSAGLRSVTKAPTAAPVPKAAQSAANTYGRRNALGSRLPAIAANRPSTA